MKKSLRSKPNPLRTRKNSRPKSNYTLPIIIGIIAILFSLKLIYSNLPSVSFSPGTSINQVGVSGGRVNLTLTPDNIVTTANTEQTLTLSIDAGADYATLAQIELNYDPAKIGTPIITQGDFLTSSIGSTKVQNGKITFTYITALPENGEQAGKKGSGTLATIKFTPPIDGESSITFGDNSLVIITDATSLASISSNMLKSANNATVKVGNGNSVSDSPSPSPSPSPTLSPSPSPSNLSNNNNDSGTDDTVVTKPSAPVNLKYNCYNGGTKITLRWDPVTNIGSYVVNLDRLDNDQDINKTISNREIDLDLSPNVKYNWSVASVKDSIASDKSTISDISCAGTTTAASPSPSITPQPSPSPSPTTKPNLISNTIKKIIKPKVISPSPTPRPTATNSEFTIAEPTPTPTPGTLADVFKSPNPSSGPQNTITKTSIFSKIFLGWQALFLRLVESFAR